MRITEVQAEIVRRLGEQTAHHGGLAGVAASTGLSLAYLSRIRSGLSPLPLGRVDAVAAALGLDVHVEIRARQREGQE